MSIHEIISIALKGPGSFTLQGLVTWLNQIWLVVIVVSTLFIVGIILLAAVNRKHRRFCRAMLSVGIGYVGLILLLEILFGAVYFLFPNPSLNLWNDVNILLVLFPPAFFFFTLVLARNIQPLQTLPIIQRIRVFVVVSLVAGFLMYLLVQSRIFVFASFFQFLLIIIISIVVIYFGFQWLFRKKRRE